MREPTNPSDTLHPRRARVHELDLNEYTRLVVSRRHLEWVRAPEGVLRDLDTGERFVLRDRSDGLPSVGA